MVNFNSWHNKNIYDEINSILRAEGVIATDSDTVLGLLAPLTQAGYDKLNEIKHRSGKPYLVLVCDKQKALQFSDVFNKKKISTICEKYWPGPLTIIVQAKKELPDFMKSKEGTIAIRVPDHAGLQKLLADYDGLFSTSANRADRPIPQNVDELDEAIKNNVDLIISKGKSQDLPSTIIDCTGDEIKVIREGASRFKIE